MKLHHNWEVQSSHHQKLFKNIYVHGYQRHMTKTLSGSMNIITLVNYFFVGVLGANEYSIDRLLHFYGIKVE